MAKRLKRLIVGPYEVNCYLFWDEETKDGVVIDPGTDGDVIAKAVVAQKVELRAVLLTHGHGDHIGAVRETMERFSLPPQPYHPHRAE